MAILKHIKSRNANYSDALNYLLYQHDEETGKPILDEYGNKLLREEFYMDGLNCSPLSFDKDCRMTNKKFNKNQKKEDIKSHHYIISFDPADAAECGLTGNRAQELCLEFARKNFPSYQALVVTHTDGGNHSGNIHSHIVINSVRKYAVERQDYMDKPNEEKAGYKHRSTNRFLGHLKKEVMAMCEREGLHQIDLLSPAPGGKEVHRKHYVLYNSREVEKGAVLEKHADVLPEMLLLRIRQAGNVLSVEGHRTAVLLHQADKYLQKDSLAGAACPDYHVAQSLPVLYGNILKDMDVTEALVKMFYSDHTPFSKASAALLSGQT